MVDITEAIITCAYDLELIIEATKLYAKICNKSLPVKDAGNAFDSFHKVYAPMLKNYQEVGHIKDILDNFDKELEKNYPNRF